MVDPDTRDATSDVEVHTETLWGLARTLEQLSGIGAHAEWFGPDGDHIRYTCDSMPGVDSFAERLREIHYLAADVTSRMESLGVQLRQAVETALAGIGATDAATADALESVWAALDPRPGDQ